MNKKNVVLKTGLFSLSLLFLVACGKSGTSESVTQLPAEIIEFKNLIPNNYSSQTAIDELKKDLDSIEDPNLKAEMMLEVYQTEINNAPMNTALAGKRVRIPGFIAPLEHNDGVISQFLLVPYAGACIHTPAPPSNQVLMIKSGKNKGIASKHIYDPVWVTGSLEVVNEKTEIGNAGYRIKNAVVELYTDEG